MATVMLKDAMNTRYMINSLVNVFEKVMDDAVSNGSIVDLADVKFGPACEQLMREKYYSKLQIIDSKNEKNNRLLQHNIQAAKAVYEDYEELQIPKPVSLDGLIKVIKEAEEGGKYSLRFNTDSMPEIAAAILLIMRRPDIEYDLKSVAKTLFSIVRKHWNMTQYKHDKYFEEMNGTIVICERNADGTFGNEYEKPLIDFDYIMNKSVVPIEFGTTYIWQKKVPDPIGHAPEEWRPLMTYCFEVLKNASKPQKRGKQLIDELVLRKE